MGQPQRTHTVLVIDDEPIILRVVRAALSADYNLLEADTAARGLEIAEEFSGSIDLVVADHSLKGVSGQQAVAKIQSSRPAIQILYFSGYSRDHPANQDLPPDVALLEKPFLPRDLRGAVFRALRDRPSGAATAGASSDQIELDQTIDVRNPECAERLRDEIFRSRSLFGRLMAASALWNWRKDRYEHRLSTRYGYRDVDDAVRLAHHEALVTWLSLSLRQRTADVSIYLEGASNPGGEVRRLTELGKSALPQTAMEPERQFFLSELAVIQQLLRLEL